MAGKVQDLSTRQVAIVKTDSRKQIVMGAVYSPNTLDTQGDFMSAEWIEKMAHDFMRKGRQDGVDTEHNLKKNGSTVVESYIARDGDPDFPPGSWVVGVHIPDREIWAKVESGEINGFSMYGAGVRVEKVIEIEIPDDGIVEGNTLLFDEGHTHDFLVKLDDNGNIVGGETLSHDGHTHVIAKRTLTEAAKGHYHRYSLSDAIAKTVAKMEKSAYRSPKGQYAKPEGAADRGITGKESHPHLHTPAQPAPES